MTFTTRRIREENPSSWRRAAKRAAPFLLKCGGLLLALYGKWKVRHTQEERKNKRVRVLQKSAVLLVSLLLGLLLLAGTVKALVSLRILTIHNFLSVTGGDLPQDENGFTNLLLLGVGDKDHDGVDLTDSMMVVSLDPWKTRSAVLLSLPRDLYLLKTEKMGKGRINELYRNEKIKLRHQGIAEKEASQESLKELAAEIGRNLHLTIHHVVKVDFTAFVDSVNTIGGVDVDVPYDIVDAEYPGPNYTFETFEIRKGPQHLDGETALKYARSRHTTSDFDRSARQQQLLQALATKARAQGLARSPGTITSLLKILSDHVETTMTFGDILGAAKLAERIDQKNMISTTLSIETGFDSPFVSPGGFLYAPPRDQFEGASVLLPYSIPDFPVTWRQIQTFVRLLMQNRAVVLSKPQIVILNAGAKSGTARILGNELTRYGFDRVETVNASDDKKHPLKLPATTVVGRTDADAGLARFFSTLLSLQNSALPAEIVPEKQGQITIILGTDYDYHPLQDLLPSP